MISRAETLDPRLTQLLIRNFAIIDSIELDVPAGLTVLTGETGAGKSILVDALQLLIGARAGAEVIRHGSDRAEISARFDVTSAPPDFVAWLDEQGIDICTDDGDHELIVRRVISRDGKSRAFLNGQPVSVQTLRDGGPWLADIHGQHDFQALMRTAAQRDMLDRFAGCGALAAQVHAAHESHVSALQALAELEQSAEERELRIERLQHQIQEIDALQLQPGEPARLAQERLRLAHTGRLAETARQALDGLHDSDQGNARDYASRAVAALRGVAALDERLAALLPAMEEALIGLTDSARELARYLEGLEADPGRQEVVEQRLATLESLARKHRCEADQLPEMAERLRAELAPLEDVTGGLASRRAAVSHTLADWQQLAEQLSAVRQLAAERLSGAITERMQTLGMGGGRFHVALNPMTTPGSRPHGLEDVSFDVTANAGQPLRPLAKVASGGELSRLSLAVQVTLAREADSAAAMSRRCMVFDEVDAGVGGAVAEIVGRELAALGRHAQVLCVTHLPQVAALGEHHLRVSKRQHNGQTQTEISPLMGASRIEEIARMLGGIDITDTAREHAAQMLAGNAAPPFNPRRARGGGTAASGSARKSPKRDR